MSSDRETKLRALFEKHGRLRLHAGWPYGWASTPEPELAIHLVNTWPGGYIETAAGKKVATWTNKPTANRHSTGTPAASAAVQDSSPEALTHSTLAGATNE